VITDALSYLLPAMAFLITCGIVVGSVLLLRGKNPRVDDRLHDLSGKNGPKASSADPVRQLTRSTLPKLSGPLLPSQDEERTRLRSRLLHAGCYGRDAIYVFLGAKMVLMICPMVLGMLVGAVGLLSLFWAVLAGLLGSVIGMLAPGFWLGYRKGQRQASIRNGLPDVLDAVVICLEGGLTLPAAFQRVGSELATAHPLLASEMNIILREVQLGQSIGEALRHFADRADVEEIRSLASVVTQSQRYGASLVKAMRVYSDTFRLRRLMHAEEKAQTAAVKLLFPMLLFIFPAIFIVVLGPAVILIVQMFEEMSKP